MVTALWLGLERTRFGIEIRAAVDNRRMAESVGIDTSRLFTLAFALGSALAALGGGIGADILAIDPGYAIEHLVYFLIVVTVGGLGSNSRAVLRRPALGRLRYRVQIPVARIRRFFHLCADAVDPAVAAARPVRAGVMAEAAPGAVAAFSRRHRLRLVELLPWALAAGAYFVFPDYLALGAQVLATTLFGLSADLVLGYAGIVTLGHAAFYGVGAYTAGYLAAHGMGAPIVGLFAAALVAGAAGFLSGLVILRTRGLTLLMLTLVVCVMLQEAANKMTSITGGADGLQGMQVDPVLGLFPFDIFGNTAYCYAFVALFAGWAVARAIVNSSFGRSLTGIRENATRMPAIGAPVFLRLLTIYTISAAMAGVAGALMAETTQLVALNVLSIDLSGTILVMIILGGVGRLYGAFVGVPLYMIAQDRFAEIDPVYWYFWIGLLLVLVVVFARGGVLGLVDALVRAFARRR